MKSSGLRLVLCYAALSFFIVSCAGTPKPVEPAPAEPAPIVEAPLKPAPETPPVQKPAEPVAEDPSKMPPDQTAIDALGLAEKRAERARKQAFDADSPTYYPSDWKSAESMYVQAIEKSKEKNLAAYRDASAKFNTAADSYDAVAQKAVIKYASARKDEIEKVRSAALASKVDEFSPERLAVADAEARRAQQLYDAGDFYGAAEAAIGARSRYIVLKTGADAYSVKSEIDRRGFSVYDPSNYSLAQNKLDLSIASYDAGNTKSAQEASEESLLRFRLALGKGRELNASAKGNSADIQRRAAQDLKAHVAVKAAFDAASAVFAKADSAFKNEKFDEAAESYTEAERQFAIVRTTAADKRRLAEEAMERAQKKITESETTAQDAETILSGGEL